MFIKNGKINVFLLRMKMPKDNKLTPVISDEAKYRKKSKYKGRPRSKHKHDYKIVILHIYGKIYTGSERIREYINIAKVCRICGRIKDMNWNEKSEYCNNRQLFSDSLIEEKTKYLEHWYSNFFDNTAYKSKEDLIEKDINSN